MRGLQFSISSSTGFSYDHLLKCGNSVHAFLFNILNLRELRRVNSYMNLEFLIPFIILCICFSWSACAKGKSEQNYDYVLFYDTPLFSLLQIAIIISIIIGIIIAGINSGFLIGLAYLGVALGAFFINQLIIAHILIGVFSYQGLGAILPILCGILSAIWMFVKAGTF